MKWLLFLLAFLCFSTLSLSIFELVLHFFHAPIGQTMVHPTTHTQTWIYLLKQHYITFINSDLFTLHEKRHLLDVKRLFDRLYQWWQIGTVLTMLTITILCLRFKAYCALLWHYLLHISMVMYALFFLSSFFFLESFSLLHGILFPQSSWLFPPDSLLITWFPLSYFVEFFLIFMVLHMGAVWTIRFLVTHRHFN